MEWFNVFGLIFIAVIMIPNTQRDKSILLSGRYMYLCTGFFCCPKRRLQLNDRLNGIWLCHNLYFGEWASETTLRWDSGAGTEKRHSDRPAENNRRYTAGRVSHTVTGRETVFTVSASIGFGSRFVFRDTLKPVYKIKERTNVMNEVKNKNLFIRVSEKEKNWLSVTPKGAVFLYRNVLGSVLWDICREQFYPKCSSLSMIN